MSEPFTTRDLTPLETAVLQNWPAKEWGDVTVVLGVSGGPDSVALLRAMHQIRQHQSQPPPRRSLRVAHFNHRWRSAESDADEAFVADLCTHLNLPYHVGRSQASVTGKDEASARHERYLFLRRTAEAHGARYVGTGHTLDDQIETVLHRIIRGTGLAGLAGIRRYRALGEAVTVTRPLLRTTRMEILAYLHNLQQPFRNDSSNDQRQYTRNRLRHELLPLLSEQYNPAIGSSLLRLSRLAEEAQDVIGEEVERRMTTCVVRRSDDVVELDVRELAGISDFLCRELIATIWRQQAWPQQAMGFVEWSRIAQLAAAAPTTIHLPAQMIAERTGDILRIQRAAG